MPRRWTAKAVSPHEAIAAARAQGLLGVLVPPALGGEGLRLGALVEICETLGQACASTAMIYAMY
jgi:acyl-CoA dehydrogenase